MNPPKIVIRCYLKTVAPLHLGCDEVYEPFSFVLRDGRLIHFDPMEFFAQMRPEDQRRYGDICRRGTVDAILEIYKFLKARNALARGREVAVCPGLVSHYAKTTGSSIRDPRSIQRELNQFTIARTAFLPDDQRPLYIGCYGTCISTTTLSIIKNRQL